MVLASIDAGLLLEVVWVALSAGLTVTGLFSLVVLFGARSLEARRDGQSGSSMTYAVLAIVAITAFALIVGYGVHIMLSKG